MKTLLKLDFKRMLCDKLFIIASVVIFGLSALLPLLFKGLDEMTKTLTPESEPYYPMFSSKTFLPLGFNEFMIPLIFVLIIIYKEFSGGIVRNKVIAGYSKSEIYFSLTIVAITSIFVISLLSSMTMFGIGLALFDYSLDGSLFVDDIGKILLGVVFNFVIITAYVSISTFFSIGLQKLPIGIILAVAINSIEAIVVMLLSLALKGDALNVASSFFLSYLMQRSFNPSGVLDYVMLALVPTTYATLLIFFGYMVFRKRDLK